MQLTRPSPPSGRGPGPLSTRGGTLAVAAIVAVLAAAALLLFLNSYRDNLTKSDKVDVLVGRSLVPKGTPGRVVADDHLYRLEKVRKSQLADGAIRDPNSLGDKVVATDIYPGHQMAGKDFASADDRVLSRLAGFQRAISVPVDTAHGLIGKAQAGDRVDVLASNGDDGAASQAQVVVRNALLLAIPKKAKTRGSTENAANQSATLRVSEEAAIRLAASADGGGEIWLVLRPAVGARSPGVGQ